MLSKVLHMYIFLKEYNLYAKVEWDYMEFKEVETIILQM